MLIAGQQLQIHRIQRDDALIAKLIELESRFWWHVENKVPPPADGSDSAALALQTLFPTDNGEVVDYRFDADMNALFDELLSVRQTLDVHKAQEAALKQRIQQSMGEATKAQFASGYVSWKRPADALVLDTKALGQDHPDLLAAYYRPKASSRRFTVSQSTSS